MITEVFLDICFTSILSKKSSIKHDNLLYRDVLVVLSSVKKNKKNEIPLNIKPKFELLEICCKLKLENKSIDNIIDSISLTNRFKEYIQFLIDKSKEVISDEDSFDNVKQIRLRKKLNSLYENYDELIHVTDSIRDGSFKSIDQVIFDYENVVQKIHLSINESNRGISIESSSSLDLNDDDYKNVIEKIISKYEKTNRVSSGFEILDSAMYGGYELSRLYVYAGASGSGKSTIMVNSLINSATKLRHISSDNKTKNVYIYISLENTIEESLVRLYQDLFDKTLPQVLSDIQKNVDIKKLIVSELNKTNSVIIMKYFKPMVTSPLDLIPVIEDVCLKYGRNSIKMLVVDYLDLMKSDLDYDGVYRLELGYITLSLKSIAVEYSIPLITATQLNRGAFRVKNASELNLDQLSESTKKVDHSDCIILLVKDDVLDNKVYMKIGKNRSGRSNISMVWNVNFEKSKFLNGVETVQGKQPTTISSGENLLSFMGTN